ncbi:UDP-3-O-(3-hydroxymyristoyl)glucosamine N-acyltransferase [Nitratireductor basaltis]|uniref:UDP-3-O-acylglucosamine N-acyltransferase n=1 Tax=Nitratireductor basaltis TaxID=472175 RepID=A0A084UB48_9HYPH|nr:UDP-3-O-(3-hydroxymyristoyl)glucosamine N-acyltransferase [Nitratireductor basaltis]KFB10184.1 UDP-3-O-acylglucosamine N-acyltransferase [Nitratireductor basaltis]
MNDPVFFSPARHYQAGEIAALTGAQLADDRSAPNVITHLAPVAEGGEGALVFIDPKRKNPDLQSLNAAAILCSQQHVASVPSGVAVLVTDKPQMVFAAVGRLLYPQAVRPHPMTGEIGISPRAVIADSAVVEQGATVEAGAVLGANVQIGSGTVVAPNAVVGPGTRIGRDCFIGPNTSVQHALLGDRVILHGGVQVGQDGFGFLPGPKGLEKNPQIGRVVIQDDVEIGANTTVDRGALSDTIIGEGTKIDNLVQVAHNVRIGRGCVIAGHCGLSGSVVIGDYVMLGGRVGIADHITIGDRVQLAASSGVMNDIPAGERWAGSPAQPMRQAFREIAALRGLVEEKNKGKKRND